MDWLSIIIAILVFVLPAVFENGKKKKKRDRPRPPHPVETPEMTGMPWPPVETRTVDAVDESLPEPAAVPEPVSVSVSAPAPTPVPEPAAEVPAVPHTGAHQTASRRRCRFNARDMVIYSEIMHPKYLEK